MIRLMQCEYKKTRRRYIFLTALAVTAAGIAWVLYGNYTEFSIRNGWMMFLYQLPLINAIFMPILAVIISSRLCDIEHRGGMLKTLAVIYPKGRIYDAKFLYGILICILCVLINWAAVVVFGYAKGFGGEFPIRLYLIFLLFTVVPTAEVYIISHTLAFLFKNQAVTFAAGIMGTFAGLFSMFLPQQPIFRKIIPWGHYGLLQFVGLFGWTKESRYQNAYFEIMDIKWQSCLIIIGVCVMLYIIGRISFVKKEI